MKLSVVIPARNEVDSIGAVVREVSSTLAEGGIDYEVVVVDDGSGDGTADALEALSQENPRIVGLRSPYRPGFGFAVRAGLQHYTGDAVAIMMADGSDDPADLLLYFRVLERGYDCAFGSRFVAGSRVQGYPRLKLVINRIVNRGIQAVFRHRHNDTTNAFKAYRREVIDNVQPLLSNHFNLTVEIPLKAVVRGYTFATVPINWNGRTTGRSKLALREMGSRYLFIVLYVFLESHLARGDYVRPGLSGAPSRGVRGWRRSPGSLRAVATANADDQPAQHGVADDVDSD
jgi:dolichol-phosphate mannosyltransferase